MVNAQQRSDLRAVKQSAITNRVEGLDDGTKDLVDSNREFCRTFARGMSKYLGYSKVSSSLRVFPPSVVAAPALHCDGNSLFESSATRACHHDTIHHDGNTSGKQDA